MSYHCFIDSNGEEYGSFETVYMSKEDLLSDVWIDDREDDNGIDEETVYNIDDFIGWYWVEGFPGCLWDGTPSGPYDSEDEAIEAARE
jgi:hypothetical protein